MKSICHPNRFRTTLALLLPTCFAFWFLTAPAGMAVQRIISGGKPGSAAHFISAASEWYESPMVYLVRIPLLKQTHEVLANAWCQMLDAPDTTP